MNLLATLARLRSVPPGLGVPLSCHGWRLLPLQRLFLVAVIALSLSACELLTGSDGEGIRGPRATVELAPDIDAATRKHIVAFIGAADSVAMRSTSTMRTTDSIPAAVFATNARGEPILAGWMSPSRPASLNAASTAQLLVRLLLPPGSTESIELPALEARIAKQPNFGALVERVRGSATRGEVYASEQSVALASDVVDSLMSSVDASAGSAALKSGSASISSSEAPLRRFPALTLSGTAESETGGQLMVTNAAWVPFSFSLQTDQGITSHEVDRREACVLCLPPSIGLHESTTVPVPRSAPFEVTASFRNDFVVAQAAFDLATGLLRAAGIVLDGQAGAELIGVIGSKIDLQAVALNPSWKDALKALGDGVAGSYQEIGRFVAKKLTRGAAQSLLSLTLKYLALPVSIADHAVWAGDRGFYYGDAAHYWSSEPETSSACLETKVYAPCRYQLRSSGKLVEGPVTFTSGEGQLFTIENGAGLGFDGVDYSKVTTGSNTNSTVTVALTAQQTGFDLNLSTTAAGPQSTQFDVLYRGRRVQTVNAVISDVCARFVPTFPGEWALKYTYNADGEWHQTDYATYASNGTWKQTKTVYNSSHGTQTSSHTGRWSCSQGEIVWRHDYWTNIEYRFTIDESSPNLLNGRSIGASAGLYKMELMRQ